MAWNYLTKKDIVTLNKATDGNGAIVNEGALENAVEGPQRTFSKKEIFPTIQGKVYAMVSPIAQNHPFANGNKRTATEAVKQFLSKNNAEIPKKKQTDLEEAISRFADKDPIEEEEFTAKMEEYIVEMK